MSIIQDIEIRKEALSLLTKLSSGLRWPCNDKSLIVTDGKSAHLVELCKVNCMNYIVWSIDVVKEQSTYSQVLKVWDMFPPSKIPNLLKDLDYLFRSYNMDLMHLCKFKKLEGYASYNLLYLLMIVHSNYLNQSFMHLYSRKVVFTGLMIVHSNSLNEFRHLYSRKVDFTGFLEEPNPVYLDLQYIY